MTQKILTYETPMSVYERYILAIKDTERIMEHHYRKILRNNISKEEKQLLKEDVFEIMDMRDTLIDQILCRFFFTWNPDGTSEAEE